MSEPIFTASPLSLREVFRGAWQIVRTQFWHLLLHLILLGLASLLIFGVLGILNLREPALRPVWLGAESIWISVLMIGFLRAIALASTGGTYDPLAAFWSLGRREAWSLALLPAILNTLLWVWSGWASVTSSQQMAELFHQPQIWIVLIASYFMGTFFQYSFALYAAYGQHPKEALRQASQLFGKQLGWLFLPLLTGILLAFLFMGIGICIGVLAGIVVGPAGLQNPLTGSILAILIMALSLPALFWSITCQLLAAANLVSTHPRADAQFIP